MSLPRRILAHAIAASLLLSFSVVARAEEASTENASTTAGLIAARSFVDTSQIVSNYTTELYAHQCTMRIVNGIAYVAYQCNELTPDESKKGQLARLAIFNILNPAAARWIDIAKEGDTSPDSEDIAITIGGFVAGPIVHNIDDTTLRVFFATKFAGDKVPLDRILYRDYDIASGKLSELHQAHCTIANVSEKLALRQSTLQLHLDQLFGRGVGLEFASGISAPCDMVEIDGQLYSTIQIKSSAEGRTLLLTNILMRSSDDGATWELLGAPDPRQLPGELPEAVKILAEPALTFDAKNIYLHLRSNTIEHGYMLSRASREDLYTFDKPVTKWGYGIGRPAIADFGKPIGLVAMFTAPTVYMGGEGVSRNACDVVRIDSRYNDYRLAFPIVDYNAVNTPFMHRYRDEVYVAYTTGKRRLTPKFGTSEINFTKLRREFFLSR